MPNVTLHNVAEFAGVSMKSVSRVINREPNVSEKLRARVQSAIDSLGYVPDLAARALASSRAYMIGVLFDNPSPNYTMKLQSGAYAVCRENSYHLLVENIDCSADNVNEQIRAILMNARVDGMILTPPTTECAIIMDALESRAIPYVRIAPVSFPGRSPSVAINDGAAAAEVARHFLAQGHKRFGIVNGPEHHGAAGTRRAGFLAEIDGGGDVFEASGDFFFEQGITAGRELLMRSDHPTAIFSANDDMAAGVYAAASELGLKIPTDVSIIGFDDSWIAQTVWPGLTTVYQPISEMAGAAAKILIERTPSNYPLILPHRLVIRASTAAPPLE